MTLVLLVAVLALATACAPLTGTGSPGVAAEIDGATIPVSSVEEHYERLAAVPQFASQLESQQGMGEQVQSALLSMLIQRELYRLGAEEMGVEVSEDDVRSHLAEQAGGVTDPEELREMFASQGVSLEFIRLQSRLQLYQQRLGEELTGGAEPTEAELEEAYGELYGVVPRARHILLDTEEEAEEVLDRLEQGEDFGELAVELSTDPAAETNRGELGPINEGQFDEDFTEAVHDAEDGELIGPVETQHGYHVIERIPPPPLEEVEDQVRQSVRSEATGAALQSWTRERVDGAEITVNPRFGSWNAETGAVEPTPALDRPSALER